MDSDDASGRVLREIGERADGTAFVAVLDRVAATWPDQPLLVVLDNAGCHKGRVARAWWIAQAGQVRPVWQPPYAPHLNLVERVWRLLKDRLACHRWWADLAALLAATADLLDPITARFHRPEGIRVHQDFSHSAQAATRRWAGVFPMPPHSWQPVWLCSPAGRPGGWPTQCAPTQGETGRSFQGRFALEAVHLHEPLLGCRHREPHVPESAARRALPIAAGAKPWTTGDSIS